MNNLFIRAEDGKCYIDADIFKYSTASEEENDVLARNIAYDYATRYEEIIDHINKRCFIVKDCFAKKELEEILNKFNLEAYFNKFQV
jgi:hypothetical protein